MLTHSSEVPEKVLADDGGLVDPPGSVVSRVVFAREAE